MNKHIPQGPFTIRRSKDGCDETFEVISKSTGEFVADFHFWEAEEYAETCARWLAYALNMAEAVANLNALHNTAPAPDSAPSPVSPRSAANIDLQNKRAAEFETILATRSGMHDIHKLVQVLGDAQHWCDRHFVDFDDALLHAVGQFHRETNE